MQATGRCLCGAVTFTAENVETDIKSCHCSTCRKVSGGSPMGTSVGSVVFTGEDNITRYDSSEWADRGFCKQCGSNLFYHLKEKDNYFMWHGVFDDQTPFKLAGEIFIEEKPDWYGFAGDHPRMTGEEFMASMQQA